MAGELVQAVNIVWDIVRYGWILFLIAIFVVWKIRWKRFPLDVTIFEKRGSNIIKTNDRAGKFFEKSTGLTKYVLSKSKDPIPVPNYEWVLHANHLHTNFLERLVNLLRPTIGALVLFRYGTKQYKPIEIVENGIHKTVYKEVKDKDGNPVRVNYYEQLDPRDKLKMLDFRVVNWNNMNFIAQEMRTSQERRKKSSELWKQIILPLGMLVVTGLICIVMIKLASDHANSISGATNTNNQKAETPKIPVLDGILPAS